MAPPNPPTALFVYGTLKRGFPNPWSRRLWSQARYAGEASLPGRLYDLGAYPAFVESGEEGERVHGELALLPDPHLLAELDFYEGSAYTRELRTVELHNGDRVEAWIYIFRAPLGGARPVAGGRWPLE
ncbi:MAG: gamma-glutamylcyclotransferase family protein [Bryobacteraceae bacterium]